MTPLGHLAIGYLLYVVLGRRYSMWAILFGAILPDVDAIMLATPYFEQFHRGPTHSIFFLVLTALLLRRVLSAAGVFLGGMSHLIIDTLGDNWPYNGVGIAWLWPLTNERLNFGFLINVTSHPSWSGTQAFLLGVIADMPVALLALYVLSKSRGDKKKIQNLVKRVLTAAK